MPPRFIITYAPGDGGRGHGYDPVRCPDRLPDLRAAAVASSRICRYGGHLLTSARRPWLLLAPGDPADNRLGDGIYSVAQHSVLLSHLVPPAHALEALGHDLTEGLGIFDLQTPIKIAMPGYRDFEGRIATEIYASLGVTPSGEVAAWDKNIVWTERRDLHGTCAYPWHGPPGTLLLPLRIRPLSPLRAAEAWLRRHEEILGSRPRSGMSEGRLRWNRARYAMGLRTTHTGEELYGLPCDHPSRAACVAARCSGTWISQAWAWAENKTTEKKEERS